MALSGKEGWGRREGKEEEEGKKKKKALRFRASEFFAEPESSSGSGCVFMGNNTQHNAHCHELLTAIA